MQPELAKDAADVRLDGLLTDGQVAGDLLVAVAAGDQPEDVAFTGREGLQRVRRGGRRSAWVSRVISSGLRRAVPAAASRTAVMTSSAVAVLSRYEVAPACTARTRCSSSAAEVEYHHGGRVRGVLQDCEHGVPVEPGHRQVEQEHVRPGGGGDVNRSLAVSGLADHLDVRLLAEQVAQPVPEDAVVVGDYHADGREAAPGR